MKGKMIGVGLMFFLVSFTFSLALPMCNIVTKERIDCYPETTIKMQEQCEARGCCFDSHLKLNDDAPWCFYPSNYPTYKVHNFTKSLYGYTGMLSIESTDHHPFGTMVNPVALDVTIIEDWGLRFRLRDPNKRRFEVPIVTRTPGSGAELPLYDLKVIQDRFAIILTRKSSGVVVFNSTIGPLLFADQFLQISTTLPSTYLYGLGERHENALISTNWKRNVFWTHDGSPIPEVNLYGDHPFYMCIENDGNAHGVFFLNSNAKEVATQPAPAITWRSIGGIFDMFVFFGPTPDVVAKQYATVVGMPFMPPMWSLGFHLCKYGYNTSVITQSVVDRMRNASIPQDVQWNDIDYMKNFRDFTYDHTNYKTLPQLVDNLHENGQHYVMIIDPGISNQQPAGSYPPYDDGISSGIFIMDPENKKPIEGKVWPGKTVFPDFFHPDITNYWTDQLRSYHDQIPFDGVWLDMNEPSNFVHGSTSGCPNNTLENPPYLPPIIFKSISAGTLCASSLQYSEYGGHQNFLQSSVSSFEKATQSDHGYHYNFHSLTGMLEMKATSEALVRIRNRRPFVISRSTFPSAGLYGGHWNGDISSSWADLKQSIVSVINFNLFAIPMVGADICGFGGDTTEELCTRWMQLGAFYPFCRNHNALHSKGQAPVEFSETAQKNMRDALRVRYFYLPYLYTLFVSSHLSGTTVARGVFMEFPNDEVALSIDEQFMWGSDLLISPVLEQGASTLRMYLPKAYWYSLYGSFGKKIESQGQWITNTNVTLSDMFLHARGGSILPTQHPHMTVAQTKKSPVALIISPDSNGLAIGTLYWDDGETIGTFVNDLYLGVEFRFRDSILTSAVVATHGSIDLTLGEVYLFNAASAIQAVYLNGNSIKFNRMPYNVLHFNCSLSLSKSFEVQYK